MTTDYFNEYQAYMASGALASPARTPPDVSRPRTSSRGQTDRNFSSTSAPLPSFDDSPDSRNDAAYTVDPNRFTSNLQVSLVSEILNLRRELDSKHKFIDGLEESLKSAQTENEDLIHKLRESHKNTRQTEQRFRSLENSSFDAVEGLLHERDHLKDMNNELKSRHESQSRKAKKLEEEKIQIKDSWSREKEEWEIERRQMDRKIHVAEARLRNLIDEMNGQQAALEAQQQEDTFDNHMTISRDLGKQKKHTRNRSDRSRRSVALSIASIQTLQRPSMTSLADEMGSEDDDVTEDDDNDDDEDDEDDLPLFSDIRTSIVSRSSTTSDRKAKKILGLSVDKGSEGGLQTPSADSGRSTSLAARFGFSRNRGGPKSPDASRASSRTASPAAPETRLENAPDDSSADTASEHVKRLAYMKSSRTHDTPLSPPETPQIGVSDASERSLRPSSVYRSATTQTVDDSVTPTLAAPGDLSLRRRVSVPPLEVSQVPFITVQAPMSPAFATSVLPPGTRSVFVQTDNVRPLPMQDAGVQTEVRIDRRPIELPQHLLPGALDVLRHQFIADSSKFAENSEKHSVNGTTTRVPYHRTTFSKDGHRFPLKPIDLPPPRLLAAPVGDPMTDSEVEVDRNKKNTRWQADSSGSDFQIDADIDTRAIFGNMPELVRPNVRSLFDGPPKTVPEDRAISPAIQQTHFDRWSSLVNRPRNDSGGSSATSRPSSSRRGTGSFFDAQERRGRPQSNSTSSSVTTRPPPFPIPSRSSSRPQSHAGTDEPRSPTFREANSVRSRRSSRDTRRASEGGLRKVQSSGSIRHSARPVKGRRRRAPNLEPIQSVALDAAVLDQQLISPTTAAPPQSGSLRDQLTVDYPGVAEESAVEEREEEGKMQDHVVVDAIAATMVGEWMWKYTRRRKSFGFGDSRADQVDDNTGSSSVRHKRWVWLSPYERTVMWSSKQPNSGPALLGKNGRKLVIKSVLDVKDANPLPKGVGHEPIFDRSILILTPERALRFTAPSKERHYLWLTALSFLAQSGRGPPMIPRMQSPIPQAESEPRTQRRTSLVPTQVTNMYPRKDDGLTFGPPGRIGTADSVAPPNISRLPLVNSSRINHHRKRSSTNPQYMDGGLYTHNDIPPALPAQGYSRRSSNARPPPPVRTQSDKSDMMKTMDTVSMDAFIGRGSGKQPPAIPSRNRLRTHGSGSTASTRNDGDPFENF